MNIIGINCFHGDSSAAIIARGKVLAAVEEERFTRTKHWAGLPIQSIRYCLQQAGIEFSQVDHVAVNSDDRAHRWKKLGYVMRSAPSPKLLIAKLQTRRNRDNLISLICRGLECGDVDVRLHHVEHHLAHLASAFYPSRFDAATVVSVDGFGDFSSAAWGSGEGASIKVGGYTHFPHSMGIFYQAMTQYLGFPNYGDEYKVMGLASYGQPRYLDHLDSVLSLTADGHCHLGLDYFIHHRQPVSYQWDDGIPKFENLYAPDLIRLLGPARLPAEPIEQRHHDIAASTQAAYERTFFAMLNQLGGDDDSTSLALAGGCAMNSVANGKIREQTGFRQVFIQPAAGDAGGAIGAALEVWSRLTGEIDHPVMPHAYLGPEFDHQALADIIEEYRQTLRQSNCRMEKKRGTQLVKLVAEKLAAGDIVGWFQGRMEWGPRALGNRSILADPRRNNMQQILNQKIKHRESFRPFAPSILRERMADWFEADDDVPYMQKVYKIKADRAHEIPAVTHVDGTGRLQTVYRETNDLFYQLIEAFEQLTGVPLLLNTSFNENEPIVCHPREALDCFLRTRMDVLVLGNYLITRVGNL